MKGIFRYGLPGKDQGTKGEGHGMYAFCCIIEIFLTATFIHGYTNPYPIFTDYVIMCYGRTAWAEMRLAWWD